MRLQHVVTCVLLAVIASACGRMGLLGNTSRNVMLGDSAAQFHPSRVALGVGESAPLTLVVQSRLDFAYVDLSPQSGGVTLSNFTCEPAGSCLPSKPPDPEYPSDTTMLLLYGAKSIAMTVTGVRAGRTRISTELVAHDPCDDGLNCTSYYANPSVEIEVRP